LAASHRRPSGLALLLGGVCVFHQQTIAPSTSMPTARNQPEHDDVRDGYPYERQIRQRHSRNDVGMQSPPGSARGWPRAASTTIINQRNRWLRPTQKCCHHLLFDEIRLLVVGGARVTGGFQAPRAKRHSWAATISFTRVECRSEIYSLLRLTHLCSASVFSHVKPPPWPGGLFSNVRLIVRQIAQCHHTAPFGFNRQGIGHRAAVSLNDDGILTEKAALFFHPDRTSPAAISWVIVSAPHLISSPRGDVIASAAGVDQHLDASLHGRPPTPPQATASTPSSAS